MIFQARIDFTCLLVAKTGPIRMAPTNALIAHRQGLEEIEV